MTPGSTGSCVGTLEGPKTEEITVDTTSERGTDRVKRGLAEMLKGGVIMDVVNAEQAKIAEEAGAVSVMALERVPADIRALGGVARMADPAKVEEIVNAVSIPVMAKARIGHFVEARVLESLGVDYIDESEVLTPVDEHHVDKRAFTVPFVNGAKDLGEALRRIGEGAAMIRTKGEPGTGNVVEAVRHMRLMTSQIRWLTTLGPDELMNAAKDLRAPIELVRDRHASCGQLRRRWDRDTVRRCTDDATRMRRHLRGIGCLQVRRPDRESTGHRRSDHVLSGRRQDRRGLEESRRGNGRYQHRHHARRRSDARPGRLT